MKGFRIMYYGNSSIHKREGENPGVLFVSGAALYDEEFIGGKLLPRYRSACGQVWPDMHMPPERLLTQAEIFPSEVFEITVNGRKLTGFDFSGFEEKDDTTGLRKDGDVKVFVVKLFHKQSGLKVNVCTRIDGGPVMIRWLELENTSGDPVGIDSIYPMAGVVHSRNMKTFERPVTATQAVGQESGAFSLAYNHSTDWGTEGDFYFESLKPGKFRFDGGRNGLSGYSRPAFWLKQNYSGSAFVCEFGYSGNWEFIIRNEDSSEYERAGFAIGIPAIQGEYIRVLAPGEKLQTPFVHAAYYDCDVDSIVQAQHRHVRNTVMPKSPAGYEVEIEANHRGYLCDRESVEGIRADINVAKSIGAEMYVIDAGWYGNLPNLWWRNVGDWFAGEWLPGGMRPIADYAREKGMRFGLWIEIEAAGPDSDLKREKQEWLMHRDGKVMQLQTGADGRALDLSKPEVIDWIENDVISRYIEECLLDMYRIDHNHRMKTGGNREYCGLKENVLWRYFDNFYAMFGRLLDKYPGTIFQNCAGGGGRLDLGILRCFHNSELTDWMRPPRQNKIYGGITMQLPPEIFLRTFGTEVPELGMEPDLSYQMRTVTICRPIFRGIAPSMELLNPYLLEVITGKLDLYKKFLRPVLIDCEMYHHTPMQNLYEPDDFGVYEFASAHGDRAFAALFRLNMTKNESYRLFPRSVCRESEYRVFFDNTGESISISGRKLIEKGLNINFHGSEIVTFERM